MTNIHKHISTLTLAYRRDRDGCDDTWDIYDVETGDVLFSIPFWDTDPEWMARAEATARLFTSSPTLLRSLKALRHAIGELPITVLTGPLCHALYQADATISEAERA